MSSKVLLKMDQEEIQMIVFRFGSEEYAVPITAVQEIIMPQKPTRIPKAPSFVEGIINLRGHIIPVIDGRKKFNLISEKDFEASLTEDARIILLEVNNDRIGLIVDEVLEVIHLRSDNIEPPPMDIGLDVEYLYGVGKYNNKLLILLNIENFLTVSEEAKLNNFKEDQELSKDSMKGFSGE